jgi:hypothetical protein
VDSKVPHITSFVEMIDIGNPAFGRVSVSALDSVMGLLCCFHQEDMFLLQVKLHADKMDRIYKIEFLFERIWMVGQRMFPTVQHSLSRG